MSAKPSTFAPFRHPAFRTLWTATLVSNFGGLVQAVSAADLILPPPAEGTAQADRFGRGLGETARHRIAGNHLELLDAEGAVMARFEAVR